MATARLYGLLRFYHPSDGLAKADWDRFGPQLFRAADAATDREDLARRLGDLLSGPAPTVALNGKRARQIPAATGTQVAWVHDGYLDRAAFEEFYGAAAEPEYRSERVFAPPGAGPMGFPQQMESHHDLGAGLVVDVPLVLPASGGEALPASVVPAVTGAMGIGDPHARMAAVAYVWNAQVHFSPYLEDGPKDPAAPLEEALEACPGATTPEAFVSVLRRMLAPFQDAHTDYIAGDFKTGWLPIYTEWRAGSVVVMSLLPEVEAAGLQCGDVIQEVDGTPISTWLEARLPLVPYRSDKRVWHVAMNLTRGTLGTNRSLLVRRGDGSIRSLMLSFKNLSTEEWDLLDQKLYRGLPSHGSEVAPGIFYLQTHASLDLGTLSSRLAGAKALILDTRPYGTGNPFQLAAALKALQVMRSGRYTTFFQPLPFQAGAMPQDVSWESPNPGGFLPGFPIVIQDRTRSSGETFLGCFRYTGVGFLVGSPTQGCNGNVALLRLFGGRRQGGLLTMFTGMKVENHDGSKLFLQGIEPDLPVEPTIEDIRTGRDAPYEAALAWAKANVK